ncbi:MAG: Dihydroorotate dehydrogenase [Planctomycetes bacterium]|nr:Dihydroorotate dehydrogenase [Planctomycetota bacterium]
MNLPVNLATTWLGIPLAHPLMPGASPLVDDLGMVRRLEDAGAAAIVMHSLFEEQITQGQLASHLAIEEMSESSAEATSYFPHASVFALGPETYLEQIARIRAAVAVPVIASLNGTTTGGWIEYAKLMEQAGAHALELNLYSIPTDPECGAAAVEDRVIDVVRAVRAELRIPFAVKLSPYYSSLPHLVRRIEVAGADGVVLFNRFYQPDIDPERLEVSRTLALSDPSELLLRVRWLAILSWQTRMPLAASGGVHSPLDAVKALMVGASAVQLTASLLRRGPEAMTGMIRGLSDWLAEHEYESVAQLRGSMNHARCPDPAAYERGNYVRLLQSWTGRG